MESACHNKVALRLGFDEKVTILNNPMQIPFTRLPLTKKWRLVRDSIEMLLKFLPTGCDYGGNYAFNKTEVPVKLFNPRDNIVMMMARFCGALIHIQTMQRALWPALT